MSEKTTERIIHEFAAARWGDNPPSWVGLKLCEEAGEVAGAIIKREEGRGTSEQLEAEIGDILIVLSQLASFQNTTLEELRARRFEFIKARAAKK